MPEKTRNQNLTVERFIRRFDESYRLLAYYAALPLALTPELLNYLHNRFLRGRVLWEAQADLLLSDLCEQVGYEMYAMEPAVRDYLLGEMERSAEAKNMQEAAYLLLSYVQRLWNSSSFASASELEAQHWGAMAYIEDERNHVIQAMEKRFQSSIANDDKAEMSWLSRLTATFEPQLEKSQNYQIILNYAQQVSQLMGNGSREVPLPTFTFEVVTVDRYGKEINRVRRQASYFSENLGNDVKLDVVYIPGDTFMMGSPETEERIYKDEGPQHEVTVDSFFMSKYPVTQAQWEAVMGNNPSKFKGKNRPVERVSWKDAIEFCKRLSEMTGKDFWLPSEAEWEYACRAGTTTPFNFGETITSDLANYQGTSTYAEEPEGVYRKETTEVGSFPPNTFGLYDMHGNVWEWVADSWHKDYTNAPNDGGIWEEGADKSLRVLRGGSWNIYPDNTRAAVRYRSLPYDRSNGVGFRVVHRVART